MEVKCDDIEEDDDDDIKVILVGEMFTGKTSLINTSIGLEFKDKLETTQSSSILNKTIKIDDHDYTINLWDTIGQEKYRSLTTIFMKDAKIIIFVYDITNLHSFNELRNYWFESVKQIINKDTVIGIVGNKMDLYLNEKVKEEEGKKLADEFGYEFILTTAKSPSIFNNYLEKLVKIYLKKKENLVLEEKDCKSQKLQKKKNKIKIKCCK